MVHALLAVPAVETHLTGRRVHALLHARDIAPCAETLAGASEHQGTDRLVGGHRFERVDEFRAHVVAHGVALVGAVQRERGDAVVRLQFNQVVVHGVARSLRGRSLIRP
ncbi:hypothetical protein FQZ97_1005780 [compost metagenome]